MFTGIAKQFFELIHDFEPQTEERKDYCSQMIKRWNRGEIVEVEGALKGLYQSAAEADRRGEL